MYFEEITNGSLDINRDYAVGILNKVLPLKPAGSEMTFLDKIVANSNDGDSDLDESKIDLTQASVTIQPVNAFMKNGQSQVKVNDSRDLKVIIEGYTGDIETIDVALCYKNLCVLKKSQVVKGGGKDGEYMVTLPEELEAGVPYYVSSLMFKENGQNKSLTSIAKSEFLVVNNDTKASDTLTMIQSRTELDNYIAYSGQPLAIDFYADWCGPCVMLAPIYKEASQILDGDITMLKVDIDVINTSGFEVYSIPNQQFFEGGGEKVGEYIAT